MTVNHGVVGSSPSWSAKPSRRWAFLLLWTFTNARVVVLRYAQAAKPEQAQPEAQAQQTLGFSLCPFNKLRRGCSLHGHVLAIAWSCTCNCTYMYKQRMPLAMSAISTRAICTHFWTMRPFCTHNFAEFPQKILQKIIYAERCQVLTLTSWEFLWYFNRQQTSITLSACLLRRKLKLYHEIFAVFLWIFN